MLQFHHTRTCFFWNLLHTVSFACIHPLHPLLSHWPSFKTFGIQRMIWGPTAPTFSGAWIESQHLKSLLDLLIQNFPHKILRWFSVQEVLLRLTLDFIRCYLLPETLPESFYKVFFPGVLTSACACLSHSILVFRCSVASSYLWPHEQQHARLPCPSLSPRVCTNSCLLSW